MTDHDPAKEILDRMIERVSRRENVRGLPNGMVVHAVERARSFGDGARLLEGAILIEEAGEIRRASGSDLAMLNEIAPEFLRSWRLSEGE